MERLIDAPIQPVQQIYVRERMTFADGDSMPETNVSEDQWEVTAPLAGEEARLEFRDALAAVREWTTRTSEVTERYWIETRIIYPR